MRVPRHGPAALPPGKNTLSSL